MRREIVKRETPNMTAASAGDKNGRVAVSAVSIYEQSL
jgi:hypothetical protein